MFVRLALISWKSEATEGERSESLARLEAANTALSPSGGSLVAADLPPNRNGGDVIWRLAFESRAEHDASMARHHWQDTESIMLNGDSIGHIDAVTYESIRTGDCAPQTPGGLYRLLLFAVSPDTPPATLTEFETEMLAMPNYVSTILRWNLGRVSSATGSRSWTYLWEQEFADLAGFRGEYMRHPYHWSHLDRWFDCDNPARIVDSHLCNSFCPIDAPIFRSIRN